MMNDTAPSKATAEEVERYLKAQGVSAPVADTYSNVPQIELRAYLYKCLEVFEGANSSLVAAWLETVAIWHTGMTLPVSGKAQNVISRGTELWLEQNKDAMAAKISFDLFELDEEASVAVFNWYFGKGKYPQVYGSPFGEMKNLPQEYRDSFLERRYGRYAGSHSERRYSASSLKWVAQEIEKATSANKAHGVDMDWTYHAYANPYLSREFIEQQLMEFGMSISEHQQFFPSDITMLDISYDQAAFFLSLYERHSMADVPDAVFGLILNQFLSRKEKLRLAETYLGPRTKTQASWFVSVSEDADADLSAGEVFSLFPDYILLEELTATEEELNRIFHKYKNLPYFNLISEAILKNPKCSPNMPLLIAAVEGLESVEERIEFFTYEKPNLLTIKKQLELFHYLRKEDQVKSMKETEAVLLGHNMEAKDVPISWKKQLIDLLLVAELKKAAESIK